MQCCFTLKETHDNDIGYHFSHPDTHIDAPSLAKAIQFLIRKNWHIDQVIIDPKYNDRMILVSK